MKSKSTKKSVSDRIRITKNGKVVRRTMGIGHFRTRKSTKTLKSKKRSSLLTYPTKSFLSYATK